MLLDVPNFLSRNASVNLLAIEAKKGSDLYNNMPSVKSGNKDPKQFHASDFRFVIVEATKSDVARKMLEDFVGEENVDNVLAIFGLAGKVDELSAAGGAGASVEGYGGPLVSGSAKRRRPKKKTANENIAIANEVLRLIKERGILRWTKKKKLLDII